MEMVHNRDIDMVLLDLQRPGPRGDRILEGLKTDLFTADLPIVVLTADATAREMDRLRALGAQEVVTKPFDIERLLSIVDALGNDV